MKNAFKKIVMVMAAVVITLGQCMAVFANDDNIDPGSAIPLIVTTGASVFEVTAGNSNEIKFNVRNAGGHAAKHVIISATISGENNPFVFEFLNNCNSISNLSPTGERTITMKVDVDKTAETKTYPINLNFSYTNNYSGNFTGTGTIYLKVNNGLIEPKYTIEDFKMQPETIEEGESAVVSGMIINNGIMDMVDTTITATELDGTTVSINGSADYKLDNIGAGTRKSFNLTFVAANELAAGNYPVKFKLTYRDMNSKTYEKEHVFYVSVGGATTGKKADIEIINIVEPSGVYTTNQNFNVTFDVINNGDKKAEDVTVKAETSAEEGGVYGIVPKSTSVKNVGAIEPGESSHLEFTFAPTSDAKDKNYTIMFTVSYNNGKAADGTVKTESFSQYAGVNVKGENDDTESKPKIIVSKYEANPVIVMAGQEFDLNMTFLNTHPTKGVRNIKMFLTLEEETSSKDTQTGNIFTPVNSSNTFYFDSIPSKGTVSKLLRLYTMPDAQPKTYTVKVNFEYEDSEGKEFTGEELLGINVKQPTELELSEIYVPPTVEAGYPVNVSFELYNTGKVTLNNLMIKLEGEVDAQTKSTYLGNFESGYNEYYDNTFSIMTPGKQKVAIVVSYDDPSGETFEERKEFDIEVTEPAPMLEGDMMGGEDMMMGNDKMAQIKQNIPLIAGICAGVVVVIIIAVVVIKKKKEKSEAAFLAAEDEEDVDTEKGNDIDA